MKTRLCAVIGSSGLASSLTLSIVALLASAAQAMPPVMDKVSDDAMIVLTVPAPATLEKNLGALTTAIESPMPLPSIKDILAMGGMGAGVDATKAFAMIVLAPPPGVAGGDMGKQAEDRMLVLLPVTTYNEFIAGMGGKVADDAKPGTVNEITMTSGEQGFAKDLGGGYALLGSKKDIVEKYTGKPGANPLSKRVGKAGDKLADDSDIVTFVNMEHVRPLVPGIIDDMKKQAREQAEMVGAGGDDVEKRLAGAIWLLETISKDSQAVVGGIKLSSLGVAADMTTNFIEGSTLAKAFASGGKPASPLGKLPGGGFLAAGAIDMSNAMVKQLFKDLVSKSAGDDASMAQLAALTDADGVAAVMGVPAGGAIAGLMTATVGYTQTKDPAAALGNIKKSMLAMDGQKQGNVKIKATYADAGAKVGETSVDVWDMKMAPEGGQDEGDMSAQGMAFIFGPQGSPGGYLAKTDSGVYTTYAKNSDLMAKALAAAQGQGEVLGADKLLQQVGEKLPSNRLAEAYIGFKSILDLTLPFAGMAGIQIPMDKMPQQIPPVGMAISSDSGSARMSVFVPAPVLKAVSIVGTEVAQQFMGGMGGEPGPDPANGGKGKDGQGRSGQPRF